MLVIISDLHLTDGSTGNSLPTGAFQLFVERLEDLAVGASWRLDGTYRPIDRLDVVLLGDFLDIIRSARWLQSDVRPWDDPHSPAAVAMISRITADILRQNQESCDILRRLSSDGGLTIPPANRMSQPVYGAEEHAISVSIHYMVGNHDWFLHLPGRAYDALRKTVTDGLGLCHSPDVPFPHDAIESEPLQDVLRRHKVLARHGDLYDPFNFEGDRNASSLGDAIVIELLNRFSAEIEQSLVDELPVSTVLGLREIDNIRPTLLAPVWIDGLLERSCAMPAMRKQVKMVWDRLADRFLNLDFVRQRDTWSPVDLVDGLQRVLKFSKRLSVGWSSAIVNWIHGIRGSGDGSYYRHALGEQDFRNRRAKYVVYGHTHHAESVPLDASYSEGYVLNQMYFNSGTWRRLHRPTQLAPAEHEFIADDCMTFLAFYHGDERKGRPYETWSGTLGIRPTSTNVHRIDPGHARGLILPSSKVPGHAPHFNIAPLAAAIAPARRS